MSGILKTPRFAKDMPKETVRMPQPTDPDIVAARRQQMTEEERNRKGRASTRLAGGGSTPSYSRTTLG